MKTLNDSPARYAAQLAETIGSLHRHLAAEQPDWWQQVVTQLHSQLDKQFPPFYDDAPDIIPPWKGGNAPIEQPDFLRLPEMAPTRMNLLEWRQNGFEQRLGELEARAAWLPIASGNDNAELAESIVDSCFPADVIPPYKGRPDRHCPVCEEPEDKPHAPDCEYAVLDSLHLPGMENSRLNAMDWRFNGIEERLGTIESNASAFRLNALEERLAALEDWADIDFTAPANNGTPDCIHELIAEGMTGVTTDMHEHVAKESAAVISHCQESAAALVTVATAATDKRIDAIAKQAELLQSLVLNVKELLLNVDARLDALETKTPC